MSTDPLPDDAALDAELKVIEALADKAMIPWNDRLSPADRARVRDGIIEALATHPNATRLIAQLVPPPVVEASGEVGEDGKPVDANQTDAARGRSGTK